MAKQLVPDTAMFRLEHRGASNQDVFNLLYVRNIVSPWTASNLGAMAATIGNAWRDEVMPLLSSSLTFDKVYYEDLGADPGLSGETEYDEAGGDVAQPISVMNAALAIFSCEPGALPKKGHLFISGLTTASSSGSSLDSTFRTDLATALEVVNDQIAGGANAQVRVSRFLNNAKRAEGVTNQINTIGVRLIMGAQRDRRAGEGS
jgi:hypothetical protein